jgi:conjugative transfer region protein TrbK
MNAQSLERLLILAAVVLVVFVVAACALRLQGDEGQTSTSASADVTSDPLATKLAECRTVTHEQEDALSECRKVWTEKRRQFLGQKASSAPSENRPPREGSHCSCRRKTRAACLPSYPPIQQTGKE